MPPSNKEYASKLTSESADINLYTGYNDGIVLVTYFNDKMAILLSTTINYGELCH